MYSVRDFMKIGDCLQVLLVGCFVLGGVGCGDEVAVEIIEDQAKSEVEVEVVVVVVDLVAGGDADVSVFEGLIKPLLDDRCVSCHREGKDKGDVRLDNRKGLAEVILGEDDGEASAIMNVLTGHEDFEQMPPKEKDRFDGDEVAAIKWWVEDLKGDYEKKIGEVKMPAEVKGVFEGLAKIQIDKAEAEKTGAANDKKNVGYSAAALAAVNQLRDKQVAVMRVSGDGQGLLVDFTAAVKRLGAEDLKLLEVIGADVAWLKVARMKIGDGEMKLLSGLNGLERLDLSYTQVTDAGLKILGGLERLKVLHLVGTKIGDGGVATLNELAGLEKVYLYGSGVTGEGAKGLRDGVVADRGEYQVSEVAEEGMKSIRPDAKKKAEMKVEKTKVSKGGAAAKGDGKVYQVANVVCPVSGAGVKDENFYDYGGKRVGFCCQKCRAKFIKEPKAFFAKLKLK